MHWCHVQHPCLPLLFIEGHPCQHRLVPFGDSKVVALSSTQRIMHNDFAIRMQLCLGRVSRSLVDEVRSTCSRCMWSTCCISDLALAPLPDRCVL